MRKKWKKTVVGFLTVIVIALMPMSAYGKEDLQQREQLTPSGIAYADLQQEIDTFIEERKAGCASVSVEVFQGNTTLGKSQYGYADMENKIAVNADTVYEWGSVSKLLVWTSVMQLYEQGKLDLSADIRNYLPKGFLKKLKYDDPITMIHLMNHDAGWQEVPFDVETQSEENILSLEEALQYYEPAQIYRPGTVTAYSNWGCTLAAYIVQRISGNNYVDYVHENILNPLGMQKTSVAADYSDNMWVKKQRNKLNCYVVLEDCFEDYGTSINYVQLYPAASAAGTLDDFATFAKAFATPEVCPLFEKEETLTLLKTATSYYGDSEIARNCHGFWTNQYREDILGHSGNTSGCTTTLMWEPNSGLGIVIMTNEMGETAFNYGLLSLIYGDYADSERIAGQTITDGANLSGIYTTARTYEKGFASIYKYMGGLMPLQKGEQAGEFQVMLGDGTLTQVANHQYIMDNHNGWRYLMYETTDKNGNISLQMMSTDTVKQNSFIFGLKIFSMLGMVLAILTSALLLILRECVILFRKIFHKQMAEDNKKRLLSTVALLANTIVGMVLYNMILLPLDGSAVNPLSTMLQCILVAVLSIVSPACAFGCLKRNSLNENKKRKLSDGLTVMLSSFVFLFVLYWRLFVFWGC